MILGPKHESQTIEVNENEETGAMLVLLLSVRLIVNGVGQVGAAPIVLRFGGIQSVTDATTRAMMQLAEQVERESNGRLKIEVYPASQPGDGVSQIEGVNGGLPGYVL